MGRNTGISWTDATWSPIRARVKANAGEIATAKGYTSLVQIATKMAGHVGPHCEHVSHGCDHCYSDTNNGRCLPANGTGLPFDRRARDLVDPFVDEKILLQPLKWRKPVKVFVENQSDLFGEWVTDEQIDRVFAVMALCPQHTFQVLTKRPERMAKYLGSCPRGDYLGSNELDLVERWGVAAGNMLDGPWIHIEGRRFRYRIEHFISTCLGLDDDGEMLAEDDVEFPLPNVWLGVSCEDQKTADARTPFLLQTPAAVRFVSYEPALGPVDFDSEHAGGLHALGCGDHEHGHNSGCRGIDWVIVGGESGPGARPFDTQWARQTIEQCREAGVVCFVKQLGRVPIMPEAHWREQIVATGNARMLNALNAKHTPNGFVPLSMQDRKGGSITEWPEDLRVREFPKVAGA